MDLVRELKDAAVAGAGQQQVFVQCVSRTPYRLGVRPSLWTRAQLAGRQRCQGSGRCSGSPEDHRHVVDLHKLGHTREEQGIRIDGADPHLVHDPGLGAALGIGCEQREILRTLTRFGAGRGGLNQRWPSNRRSRAPPTSTRAAHSGSIRTRHPRVWTAVSTRRSDPTLIALKSLEDDIARETIERKGGAGGSCRRKKSPPVSGEEQLT